MSTVTFERKEIHRCNLIVFESSHSELEFGHKFCSITMEIERVIDVCIWPSELPEMWIPIMRRFKGIKVEVQRFVLEFGSEIVLLSHRVNHLRI